MSADFWAGYLSGAIGIIIGNPLDLVKTRAQAADCSTPALPIIDRVRANFDTATSLVRGATAPILTYGALNAILFVAYNRTILSLAPSTVTDPTKLDDVSLSRIWVAGAVGGIASWIVSCPTELVKCRAQLSYTDSSWSVTKDILRKRGLSGLYYGGGVTSVRDSVGYGFYFWSYELCKRVWTSQFTEETASQEAIKVLMCGGIAGITTWASVFPLDVVKTRLQAQDVSGSLPEWQPLLENQRRARTLNTWEITKQAYRSTGLSIFYRGLGICSLRAFIVNGVQWTTYEWMMKTLRE